MSATSLLLWMSARGEGSWEQFRASVEELHLVDEGEHAEEELIEDAAEESGLPLYHLLKLNLQRLGHSEFNAGAGGSDWRVTPPCIALTEHPSGSVGVLTGARSPALLARLRAACEAVTLETHPWPASPDIYRLRAPDSKLIEAVGNAAGIRVQRDAANAILMSLPPIDDRSTLPPAVIPEGVEWTIERFSLDNLKWRSALRAEATGSAVGLFRFALRYRREVLLCTKQGVFRVPIQIGKYIVLKRGGRRRLMRYDAAARRLSVPASVRPPFLVERALLACSGALPAYEPQMGTPGWLHYSEVPAGVAQLATAVLRQELQ